MAATERRGGFIRGTLASLLAAVLLASGVGVSALVSDALGIRAEASERMGAVAGPGEVSAAGDAEELPLRMVDLGAVGVAANPDEWRDGTDYSHASKAFARVFLPEAPYIDEHELAIAYDEFDDYLTRMGAYGYNAVAFPGFIEFVSFEGVEDHGGLTGVYPAGDAHLEKALALREAFTPFWNRAEELGFKVFLRTDMLTLTEPLGSYLVQRFGSLDTENPELWEVYAAALDELYAAAPSLDGVLIRIGEAGRVYDVEGWDYFSELAVTTKEAVRAMLTAFSAQAERSEREVIFRSWSVGVGEVGDMHTNAESYRAVLDGIDSPALIVSTKYTLGDFYSWLPLNDTLLQGEQRRIVELQSRREFENNGAFPNDLGAEYAWALRRLVAENPRIEGVWTWTQDGGPWRAGPMILEGKAGFWQLADLNTRLAAELTVDPDADPRATTGEWAEHWFSDDPDTVRAIVDAMALSRTAIEQGLYIEPFAEQRVFAIGLEPPPMMWIFEWDILTGDSAVLSVIYEISRDRLDEAIRGGEAAIEAVAQMRGLIAATDEASWRDAELRERFLDSLDYQQNTLELLGAYRAMFLHQAAWHDTRGASSYQQWRDARDDFEALAAVHLERYEGDVDYPAYNLTAAELGVQRGDRDLAMAWTARVLLVLLVAWLAYLVVKRPKAPLLLVGVPLLALIATRLVQTSLLSWSHVAITVGAWLLFGGIAALLLRGRAARAFIAAAGFVTLLRCALAMLAVSFTGPGGYWFAFWTEPTLRSAYIAVAFALWLCLFIVAGRAAAQTAGSRRATGAVLAGMGTALAVPAGLIALLGLEQSLTTWNDQLGLLPWGLSRILGITVYLEIPASTALYAAAAGALLAILGAALALLGRSRADSAM